MKTHPAADSIIRGRSRFTRHKRLGGTDNGNDGTAATRIAPHATERDGRVAGRSGAVIRRGTRPEHRTREHRRSAHIILQSALPHTGLAGAAAGGDHRARVGDRRSPPSPVGPPGQPFSPRSIARRHWQRPQNQRDGFYRVRLDVPRRRPDRNEAGRRNRVRTARRR